MNQRLLKEYVRLVLEKIRTVKGDSPFGEKFNFDKFKQMPNIHMMNAYAESFLQDLGEGSSRKAYVLSATKALKIAKNEKGIAQNETELDVFTNPKTKPMVAKIHSYDPGYQWLIADVVRPLQDQSEFEDLTGMSFIGFTNKVQAEIEGEGYTKNKLVIDTANTIRSTNLLMGDVALVDHWGKTPDGRIVLLDYGFTKEVWEKHYKQRPNLASTFLATMPFNKTKKVSKDEEDVATVPRTLATLPMKDR